MSLKKTSKILYFFSPIFFLSLINSVRAKSNLSDPTSELFTIVTIISAIVLLLVLILWGLFIFRYREENQETERKQISHTTSKKLEMGWTGVAAIIVIALMVFSYPVLVNSIDRASDDANGIPIVVEGTNGWEWVFHYDGNQTRASDPDKHRPADLDPAAKWTEIELPLGTYTFTFFNKGDYIHSFYVHELNIKMDVVPGQNNTLTVEIQETGVFEILCAEYCGPQHSYMRGAIIGVNP